MADDSNSPSRATATPRSADGARGSATPDNAQHDGKAAASDKDAAASAPPLPDEAPPEDDGWDFRWDYDTGAYYFVNRITGHSQWENPRAPQVANESYARSSSGAAVASSSSGAGALGTSSPPRRLHGGYNPAIHGSYDPNADYAQEARKKEEEEEAALEAAKDAAVTTLTNPSQGYTNSLQFNRFTGKFQDASVNPENHNDHNKSGRQMRSFFDIDAAANSHDGRSLKAERRGKTLSKKELQAYKEKRHKKKEEKRRAWLRD